MPNIIEITDFPRAGAGPLRPPDAEPAAQSAGTRKGIFIAESPKVISRALDAALCRSPC